ncbi:ATP-binding cassette domain-containing protein [Jiella sp. MQZ9-1]|uniref:ATP-binding cassette domain-containing protein n=1 Tax=Jiella flava TaxID=2816857 RepID=A0A939FZ16_9HYPH|nr:ATP-binding cassette domain-containing protein [Jiella flava]MBO0663346.1 ATP-binding cassette domain-containing protein [Jiella flava]MCD2471922.1 ATP-binding cassette domain-containing protein [Jiella flava]
MIDQQASSSPRGDAVPPSTDGLVLDRVAIRLAGRQLLALDHRVAPGDTLTVMGPSGSGKSTLFAFVAGFLDPAFEAVGRVCLNGRDLTLLPPRCRRVGLLFQDALLLPHMSVGDNLLFALPANVKGSRQRRAAAEAMLSDVGLAGHFSRDPATLSGGQAARVALARTLLAKPEALLLDEPFARLDQDLRATIRDLVFQTIRARKIPAVLVTHDPADAQAAGSALVEIGSGEGTTV